MAKVILLIVLILKATSSFGVEIVISSHHDHETIETSCSDQPCDEKDDCCDGSACDCMCCGHVFIDDETATTEVFDNEIDPTTTFSYESQISLALAHCVWHPPCLK